MSARVNLPAVGSRRERLRPVIRSRRRLHPPPQQYQERPFRSASHLGAGRRRSGSGAHSVRSAGGHAQLRLTRACGAKSCGHLLRCGVRVHGLWSRADRRPSHSSTETSSEASRRLRVSSGDSCGGSDRCPLSRRATPERRSVTMAKITCAQNVPMPMDMRTHQPRPTPYICQIVNLAR